MGRRSRLAPGRGSEPPDEPTGACAEGAVTRTVTRNVGVPLDVRRVLSRLGLEDHAELVAPYAAVELSLIADADMAQSLGCSRIGGAPDLPADLAWPCRRWSLAEITSWPDYARAEVDVSRELGQVWTEGDELVMPLPFLLQLDLATLGWRDDRLPDRGTLWFFASVTSDLPDPLFAKRVAATVCYADAGAVLAPRAHPPTPDDPPASVVALRAEPALRWDLPFEELPRLEAALPPAAFATLVADSRREVHALFPAPAEECVGPMPPPGEVALLRVHDDPASGFRVGDASWITFSIPEAALRARDFDAARASVFIG